MRVIEIVMPGGPDVLRPCDRPLPTPRPGQVLIRVHAAGVNGHDLHHRTQGSHPILAHESNLPGLEVAGDVVAVGDGVAPAMIGSRVCALLRGGGYADHAVAEASLCLPVPDGLTMIEAASLPESCFTVWSNVFTDAGARPGERLLVNGGGGGIGVTAIQIANALGLEVLATTGGAAKCALCLDLGARVVHDHREGDFVEAILHAIDGKGVDIVLEMVGGDYFAQDLAVLRPDGRLACIAAPRGAVAELDFEAVVRKRLRLTGSTLRPRSIAYKAGVAAELLDRVWPLYERGEIRPVVDSVFPLAEAAAAHARMESGAHAGKIVLTMENL